MRFVALVAVLAALPACRDRDAVSVDAAIEPRLRVATFNVRRFFDTVCDSGACEAEDYEVQLFPAYFAERAAQIADAIRALDADVVSLQEIESQACLDAILLHLPEMRGVLGETGDVASVDVAILSRTPIDNVVRHRADEPLVLPGGTVTTFSRELLEVHTTAGMPVVLFAAHFKSKSGDDPPRRLAEGQTSARIVSELAAREPSSLVLLAGDLNDTPGSPALSALADAGLVRVADDLAPSAQATYFYEGRGQAIDHILVAPSNAALRIPLSSRTWRDGNGYGGSDHSALTSDFSLP